MAPTPNKEAAKGACDHIDQAMPFLQPSDQERLDYANLPLTKMSCWVEHKKEGYVRGEIQEIADDGTCTILSEKKDTVTAKKDDVNFANPGKFEQATDMANMTHLNEATVLHNLAARYRVMRIYTYSGLFCVCVNPYKWLQIYGDTVVAYYRGKKRTECPPHLYSIADNAYQDMLRERENQSILITGESGAGKTENTKKVIGYMAAVAGSGTRKEGEVGLEDQIVQTNPILEAWGNAKTIRNNNSSRFGKFIRVHFGNTGKLAGGDIEVYLLEKSRVVFQLSAERNYHIFFQIMYSKQPETLEMCLVSDNPKDYFWAGQMGVITVDRMDDTFEFNCTTEAFKVLGFSDQERDDSYKISCAVIMMGDIKYEQKPRDEQAELMTLEVADKVAHLLGIGSGDMCKAFTRPRIKVGTEMVTKGQNVEQCTSATGAIAKAVFDKLFQWLVKMCNRTLDTDLPRSYFCGVLDIAGFEIFDFNTFEQLCINFTNEKLQQFFNHNMFVLEQEEYMREGIEWEMMNFGMDLQACIDLLEKPNGVFATLEEQSIVPKATDETFKQKLYDTHEKKCSAFIKPKPGRKQNAHFICKHYAGDVGYNLDGWLMKNKDPLNPSVVELLQKSSSELVKTCFPAVEPEEPSGGKKKKKKGGSMQTVGSVYRQQLNSLMATLRSTKPSFVRCIVPNEIKTPAAVDNNLILHQLRCNGVLEGIRICRKGFPNRCQYPDFFQRYKILAASQCAGVVDSKAATEIILKHINLDLALYKIGHTKVFFKAGTLADLEDIRDEILAVIMTKIQARARGKLMRVEFLAMLARVRAARCIQTNIRKFLQFRDWPWWLLFTRVKPLLRNKEEEEAAKAKEAEMMEKMARIEEDAALKEEFEKKCNALTKEKNELVLKLDASEADAAQLEERLEGVTKEKASVEADLKEANEAIAEEEAANAALTKDKAALDGKLSDTTDSLKAAEGSIANLQKDVQGLDLKVNGLNADVEQRDGSIASLQKEKKHLEGVNAQTLEDLQAMEDKANNLAKNKVKLEQTIEETEDSLEREKKAKHDVEKSKKKVEGELKNSQDDFKALSEKYAQLEDNFHKQGVDYNNLNSKFEDGEAAYSALNRKYKEYGNKIEELESEIDSEQNARSKIERNRNDLVRELQQVSEQLEEAGGATAAQVELIKRREADFLKLRRDFEESVLKSDADLAAMKKKHGDIVAELTEQVENLGRAKSKADKEKSQLQMEFNDVSAQYEEVSKAKARSDSNFKHLEEQVTTLKLNAEESARSVSDLTSIKQKLSAEFAANASALEDAEAKLSQVSRSKASFGQMVEELKRQVEEESKGKQSMHHALQAARHDLDLLHEQLEEEQEGKNLIQRALSKANGEIANWRTKYESDAIQRTEELEDAKKKLAGRLQAAEEQTENALAKYSSLEKNKARLQQEFEDLQMTYEQAQQALAIQDKKARSFDQQLSQYQSKVEETAAELATSQRDARNYQTEIYKLRSSYEESIEYLEVVKRENKNLSDEVGDLNDQLSNGTKSLHEVMKAKKKAELQANELRSALEEAEGALELEESRVLRMQMEVSQVRAEVDKKIAEKEEEFDAVRKNHARAIESMQASLDVEVKARSDASRGKKKAEAAVADLEMSLGIANKNYNEQQKNYRKLQAQFKELQDQIDQDALAHEELREQFSLNERKYTILHAEFEETRAALDTNERARKVAEAEVLDINDRLSALSAQNSSLAAAGRKSANDYAVAKSELDDAISAANAAEDRARKAISDAAKMSEDLRAEQMHSLNIEKTKKSLEVQVHELSVKLDDAEAYALKGGRKALAGLQARLKEVEAENETEQARHAETLKNYRKMERRMRELTFQCDEDNKNQGRMQELVAKLQGKLKQYKKMAEDAEEQANINLSKFRKVSHELEEAEERAEMAEAAVSKVKTSSSGGYSYTVSRKTVKTTTES